MCKLKLKPVCSAGQENAPKPASLSRGLINFHAMEKGEKQRQFFPNASVWKQRGAGLAPSARHRKAPVPSIMQDQPQRPVSAGMQLPCGCLDVRLLL